MGRAEHRRAERKNRIENKKGKVYLRPGDIKKMKEDITSDVAKFDVEVLLTCFAQVLHDQYGFGHTRVMRALAAVDETFGKVLNDELLVSDMQKRLEDEVGVTIRCD
ncbi:MAG: hypothetical protein PHS82_03270 [Lachnospiraceae bacterium]|nr:hypothetical protein [Lachnospiraceae bacterium]